KVSGDCRSHTLQLPRTNSAPNLVSLLQADERRSARPEGTSCATLVDKMARWGLTFDGSGDPLRFMEHMEERAATYQVDLRALPQAMPVLLAGRAENWFRTSRLQGTTWKTFKKEFLEFFLPPRYFQRLE
ncbi:hypothetical protein KR059_003818, partial [Drosophila kikkawai]